jgi:hypothetical protein
MDEIAMMSDEELRERMALYTSEINRINDNGMPSSDSISWEKELSYYHREMQIRSRRRDAHDRYTHRMNVEAETIRASESSLPAMDFSKNVIDGWN